MVVGGKGFFWWGSRLADFNERILMLLASVGNVLDNLVRRIYVYSNSVGCKTSISVKIEKCSDFSPIGLIG